MTPKCALCLALLASPLVGQRSDQWRTTDKALLVSSTALLMLDWFQTLGIAEIDTLHERNPILGRHPSAGTVNTYFLLTEAGNTIVALKLKGWKRSAWLAAVTAVELRALHRGARFGVTLRLP